MTADPGLRARYLDALGIDVWVPRPGRVAASRPVPAVELRATSPAIAAPFPVEPASRAERPPVPRRPSGRAAETVSSPEAPPAPQGWSAPEPAAAEVPGDGPQPPDDWASLQAEVLACTRCALHRGRTQAVFASGDRDARWMVVGEAPGADEDRQGEPFVGRAGQLLNAMLAAIGLPRPQVFVANMVKCRPPQNRDPKPEELASCRPYLERQVRLLQPTLILVVGRIAAQNLLATDAPLARLRGQMHRIGGLNTPAIVTYHPAYLLRTPADKRKAWEDLKLARRVYGELTSTAAR